MSFQDLSSSVGRNPSTDLLRTEYVSFGHVVRSQHQHKNKHSIAASEISSVNTPTFKKELSLFPLFDKFIMYTPCYIIKDRSKKQYIPILCLIFIVFIFRGIIHGLYFIYIDKEHGHFNKNYEIEIFVGLMFLLPFINNIIRIRYFLLYFSFNLWHYPSYINPKSGVKLINNTIYNRLSFLLRRPKYAKNKFGKSFRNGWILIMIIIIISIIFRIILNYKYSTIYIIIIWKVKKSTYLIYSIIYSLLYSFIFDIPDLMLLLTARIHFTECQFYISHFMEELLSMSLDEVVESNIFHKYLIMKQEIYNIYHKFYYFIVIMTFQILLGIWYGINYILSIKTWNNNNKQENQELTILWILFWILSTLYPIIQLMFALYPALKMTKLNQLLLENVNEKIDDIMYNRQKFHDENMLNEFMNIVCKPHHGGIHKKSRNHSLRFDTNTMRYNDKTQELKNKISKYSIQKSALDILSNLLNEIEENPCSFKIIGIIIDKSSLKDLIIGLIIAQIFTILWSSV